MVALGKPVSVRMHWAYAFNDDKKITAVFSYYDRSGIIETVKANLIKSKAEYRVTKIIALNKISIAQRFNAG